ncbi:hypothetical protein [Halpernia frigidisoli]|uniref:Uncharacterized protein n=1 Tax=Halpernia frigidisoli TaxID=1125876 RepID=A0A1I3HX51_9FLAO|nr:hypothetical protein [Halpernia frigidisoli]SFI40326.1 hypothetical protein SAMN05443292_2441 [Halpernia frigidisoli]
MKKLYFLFLLSIISQVNAQVFGGEIFLKDNSNLYLNQVYVTNLSTQKTVLADFNGNFKLDAKTGETIRFTSIVTDRKDVQITENMMQSFRNLIELKVSYTDIEEVIIPNFKVSGNLRKDVLALRTDMKKEQLQKAIGLPKPKGDGLPTQLPVAGFSGGGLTFGLDSIFDIISGERKKKERAQEYESMTKDVANIQKYFGDEYFIRLKIPKNLIPNFLQFVYSSDNLKPYLLSNNYEATQIYFEKYLPIYLARLKNSNLQNIISQPVSK